MFSGVAVILVVLTHQVYATPVPSLYSPHSNWKGWSGMENMYIFGDSWSDTGFDVAGRQPSARAPLGNPTYPPLNEISGAKWPVYLATQYNSSLVKTFVLAKDSSVVNDSIEPGRMNLIHQVQQVFLPLWGDRNASTWQPNNTLFAVFIGTNDVSIALDLRAGLSATFDGLMATYNLLVDQWARGTLFLNVAPLDRAPLAPKDVRPSIFDWNLRVSKLAHNLSNTYDDTKVFNFDTNKLFTQVLANVSLYPMTSQIKNTTGYCPAYQWIFKNIFVGSCKIPLDQYMWMNTLLPTYPMHDALASQVGKMLNGEATRENE